jgi:hypothetical protein
MLYKVRSKTKKVYLPKEDQEGMCRDKRLEMYRYR